MTAPIAKVLVVGRDAAAWLSALALQRSLGGGEKGIAVELLELPTHTRPQDVFTTLPTQQAFHRLLGFDENRLLRACSGIYSLGQRFSNWSGPDKAFLHVYDTHGISLHHVDFLQLWLKARDSGMPVPFEDFSLGAAAAKQGRFVILNESTEAFSRASFGYNLGALSFLQAVGRAALDAGIRHTVGEVRAVRAEGERILGIELEDGKSISADFYVDASGGEAALLRHIEEAGNFEDWSAWLPCNRYLAASGATLSPVPAFSQVTAFRAGWIGTFPLLDRTGLLASFAASAVDSDQDVLETMAILTGIRFEGDVVAGEFRPGMRRSQWVGNCVAVGEAGVAVDALDCARLHLMQTALSYLVSLFPVDDSEYPEARVFNDKMRQHAEGVRDFQVAHFKLNRRFGERLWDAAREVQVPDSLQRKLDLFAARGVVAMNENETFQEENWQSILIGHGLLPRQWDPQVDKVPEQEQIASFQRMLKFIATEVEAMPSLQAHLELSTPQATSDYIFGQS